jgi:hypothetical protein
MCPNGVGAVRFVIRFDVFPVGFVPAPLLGGQASPNFRYLSLSLEAFLYLGPRHVFSRSLAIALCPLFIGQPGFPSPNRPAEDYVGHGAPPSLLVD